MAKRSVVVSVVAATFLSVVAATFLSGVLAWLPQVPALGGAARPASTLQAAPTDVAVGTSFLIEPPMADYVRELDQREQREQVRDWAVLGTLTRLGGSAEQLAAATYQTPPARLPYLDELYAFEYGRGRRAYLGNRVLLFRDHDDPDPQATIGRLADRVRRENGEVPMLVELYVVDDQRDLGTIRVERAVDLTRQQLFSKAYGYVEAKAHTPDELAAWLDQVDDLTFAQIDPDGSLVLGGRRFTGTRTANITAEDVAAIYQAHQLLEQRRLDAYAELEDLPPFISKDIARYLELGFTGAPDVEVKGDWDVLEATMTLLPPSRRDQVLHTLATVTDDASPGFSLDPEWLPDPEHPAHPLMLARIRAFAADPCADLERTGQRAAALLRQEPDESRRTSRTHLAEDIRRVVPASGIAKAAPEVCVRLKALFSPALEELTSRLDEVTPRSWDRGLSLYHQLVQTLRQQASEGGEEGNLAALVTVALRFHEEDTRVQCARYEGLAGTRVGMTLFYTDLLAKLWESTDFGHSAPILAIPGFLSEPQMDLPAVFEKETIDNPYTRIWFGARSSGVSRSGADRNLAFVFDHRFTRIYAAGSNPAHPGIEGQPDESSRRTLGWWDRHFDEVADHEPEYHRQNQIMKWALVTATLANTPLGEALGNASVFRGFEFAEWQRSNQDSLRFAEALPAVAQGISGKECIPLLSSYVFKSLGHERVIMGGVSTVGRAAPRAVPVTNATKPLGARVLPAADLGAGTSGTATRAHPVLNGRDVTFENAALARGRTASGDVALGTPEVSYAPGAARGSVAIKAGQGKTAIGEVRAELTRDHVAIRWEDGAIERARLGKPALGSPSVAAADKAAKQGHVVDAARVYEAGLPPHIPGADKLAREVIIDIAHARPVAVRAKLEQLAGVGKELSRDARDALVGALGRESPPVARHVEMALQAGKPLNGADTAIVVERGHIRLTRDIARLPRASKPASTTDLSDDVVYIDDRLRVGQEGLLPDTGGPAARWTHQRGVKLVELKASEIGELPDRFVETSTGLTVQRAPGRMPDMPLRAPTRVFLLEKCDAEHKTATTRDDC